MTTRLSFPAPHRCPFQDEAHRWATRPYTLADVLSTWSAGGWFAPGEHEFNSKETARFAALGAAGLKEYLIEQDNHINQGETT